LLKCFAGLFVLFLLIWGMFIAKDVLTSTAHGAFDHMPTPKGCWRIEGIVTNKGESPSVWLSRGYEENEEIRFPLNGELPVSAEWHEWCVITGPGEFRVLQVSDLR
jgi:hypothetical protein